MIGKALTTQFSYNHFAIEKNLEGLTHEDSLNQPHPGGNCINWVLGHIIASRNGTLRLTGEEPIWTEEEAKNYSRGSEPIRDGSKAHTLEKLLCDLNASQQKVIAALERMPDDSFAIEVANRAVEGKESVGTQLATLAFHESYHAGQLGVLRRIAGKEGVIK